MKKEKKEQGAVPDFFQQAKELTDGLWDLLNKKGFPTVDRHHYPPSGRDRHWKETHIHREKFRYRIVWNSTAGLLPDVNRIDLEKGEAETVYGGNTRGGFWVWDNGPGEGIITYMKIDKPYTTPTTFLDGEPDYTRRERVTEQVVKRNEPIVLEKLKAFIDEIQGLAGPF